MVKKLQKISADQQTGSVLSNAVKDSAQQIWLAGLGAFSKAQEEGSKVFDALVKEGLAIQRKTQAATEEKLNEATSRMSDMASDLQAKAGNRWDKLESIFEERVAKALGKLGVPSARDVSALAERVEQLDAQLRTLNGGSAPRPTAKPRPKPAAKAAAQQPASPSAAKAARPARTRRAPQKAVPASSDSAAASAPAGAE